MKKAIPKLKKHLKKVLYIYRDHSKIIMVLDNVRYHHAKLLKKWLMKNPKLELVYLPPYSPELNLIEREWWYMRKKITHNRYAIQWEKGWWHSGKCFSISRGQMKR